MSINKLVSIKTPIIDAQDYLGIDHDKDVPWFTKLATEAEKKIGSYFQFERKRKVIDITDCVAPLPNDAIKVEIAILGDLGEGCENIFANVCGSVSNSVTNVNSNGLFLVVDISSGDSGTTWGYVNYQIQNNKLIFDQSFCGQKITIQYLQLKRDCDGFVEIGENHVEAIRWYIIFNYMFRKFQANYIDRDKWTFAFSQWERNCANARALDNEPTFSQHQEMTRLYNNAHSGIGIWQGVTNYSMANYTIW